jgi:predicted GIY-YIG superfamily endonuclease
MEFLFDRAEWQETIDRLSPRAKLYWRENYDFEPTIGNAGKKELRFSPEVKPKKAKNPKPPTQSQMKQLEDAIAFTMMDRGWLPREDVTVNKRKMEAPPSRGKGAAKGFVYLIRNGDLHKVGITTDLKRRLNELQPDEVVNTVKCKNYEQLEKDIHARFKAKRLPQSEYFRLTTKELEEIENMMESF